jgi:hypothetical protein
MTDIAKQFNVNHLSSCGRLSGEYIKGNIVYMHLDEHKDRTVHNHHCENFKLYLEHGCITMLMDC